MKQIQSTYPGLLRLCAAAVIAASPVAANAGVTEFDAQAGVQNVAGQTDRMIVKYRSTPAAAKGMDARLAVLAGARQMILARAGQQLGLRLQALHTTAGGAHVGLIPDMTATKDQRKCVEKHSIERDRRVREGLRLLFWHPSNAGHEESCMNLPGPSGKAKYSLVTDSEPVP